MSALGLRPLFRPPVFIHPARGARGVGRPVHDRLVPVALFAAILLHGLRVSLAIVAPVIGMLRPPFPRTVQAHLAVYRIGLDFLAVVIRTAAALAFWPAANSLLRTVGGGLKLLLAITTAAGGRQSELLCLSFSKLPGNKTFRVCF